MTASAYIQTFVAWVNSLHPSVSFTSDASDSHINFLDTTMYITDQRTLAVKPYVKKTNMNTSCITIHFTQGI